MGKRYPRKRKSESGSRPFSKETQERVVSQVSALAEPLCEAEGMELVYVEFLREPIGRVLRLYIDKPGGVGLEDCERVSRQLGDILDVELAEVGPYNLEVSSPGLERPLWRPRDYDRFKGHNARIKTREPLDGQQNFQGVLMGIEDGEVTLQERGTGKILAIALHRIARARLVEG
jgi:ribosome maturation factor RimP